MDKRLGFQIEEIAEAKSWEPMKKTIMRRIWIFTSTSYSLKSKKKKMDDFGLENGDSTL